VKLSVVISESVISYVDGEERPTIDLSSYFLEPTFHCTTNFRVGKKDLMLGFKDQFKGNDDKV